MFHWIGTAVCVVAYFIELHAAQHSAKLLFNAVLYSVFSIHMLSQSLYWSVDCSRPNFNDPGYCFLVFYYNHNKGKSTHTTLCRWDFRQEGTSKSQLLSQTILLTLDLMALWWKTIDLFIQVLEPTNLHWDKLHWHQ